MKHFELDVEHQYKNKFVGRHRLKSSGNVYVLGQNQTADIRLMGDGVSPIHAYLEHQDGVWTIIDAGSQGGTWMEKKAITFQPITGTTSIHIGGHILNLKLVSTDNPLFAVHEMQQKTTNGAKHYQQVIVKKNGAVLRTELLPPDQPYIFEHKGTSHRLVPPKAQEVNRFEFEEFEVLQRRVRSDELHLSREDVIGQWSAREIKAASGAAFLLIAVITGLLFLVPHRPDDTLNEIKPDNKYTRMIYDAELMKKKRAEAKEMRKTIMAAAPAAPQPQQKNVLTTPVKSKGAAPKVVSQLKLQGLNALLGKIAKRANSKGPMIAAFGKAADQAGTAGVTTVAAVGSLQGVATGMAGNGGSTYKVGGVGTFGKGSGRSIAGVGGLATGGAGTGTVGILDEETEIEGGLDKEVIARTIAGYLGEVRYCYERQLSSEPDLYGKVQVKFTIDGEGSVVEHRIGATSLDSAMVEGCILRRLARWKFPKPKGGTHVLVTYPFMFKATQ